MKMLFIGIAAVLAFAGPACTSNETGRAPGSGAATDGGIEREKSTDGETEREEPRSTLPENAENGDSAKRSAADDACRKLETGDKAMLAKQTFAFDNPPFRNSCFVTVYDPEFEDPPLGSEIAIYKDGKSIYRFESQYGPDNGPCWVTAVAFRDLNEDGLIDIVVTGKCGATAGSYAANEVFINDGKAFFTNITANDRLESFTRVKEIVDFVRTNKKLFVP